MGSVSWQFLEFVSDQKLDKLTGSQLAQATNSRNFTFCTLIHQTEMLLSELKEVLFGSFEQSLESDEAGSLFAGRVDSLARNIARNLDQRFVEPATV